MNLACATSTANYLLTQISKLQDSDSIQKGAAEVPCLKCVHQRAELCEGFSSVIAEPRNKKYNVVFFVESINNVD